MDLESKDTHKFLKLLNRISQSANSDHLKSAKFLLKDRISRKQLEKCEDMKDIFDKLLAKALIAPDDTLILRELISEVFDEEIIHMLDLYEKKVDSMNNQQFNQKSKDGGHARCTDTTPTHPRKSVTSNLVVIPVKFQVQFEYTAKRLAGDWRIMARFAGLYDEEIYRIANDHETDHIRALAVMKEWFSKQKDASSKQFRQLLRRIPRNDIADDLLKLRSQGYTQI